MSSTDIERHNSMLEQANRMLAEVATVEDGVKLRDYAEVARVYARQAKLGAAAVNHATAVKLRAEVKIADAWDQIPNKQPKHSHRDRRSAAITYVSTGDIGVDHRRLSEAQTIRDRYGDDGILEALAEANDKGVELSRRQLVDEAKRTARQAVKAERVAVIEATTADQLDTLGTYDILYVDPPWRYDAVETPDMRAIENHYPTMTLDALKALQPPANPDAVLFMWATSPKLAEALQLVDAWGFTYRTCAVWVKHAIGMGYYFRQRHELLLVAKRGNLPTPDPADRPDSVIEADRGAHSAKPDQAYQLLERMYPDRTKVEMFARQRRPGWAAWGNQA